MKGVILAGGTGSRLRPLTRIVNKHLLPVGRYPMIHYALGKLAEAGIDDILLVIGKPSAGLFVDYAGSGGDWGVRLTYKIQDRPGGVAEALALAESFTGDDKFVVLLGDNLFAAPLAPAAGRYAQEKPGTATVFLKEVDDPRRYGVPRFDGQGSIVGIVEKPEHPPSSYSVTGIYMYDRRVFDIIRAIRPSGRGELEITDVNNAYASDGTLRHEILAGWWEDAGTHKSLRDCAARLSPDPEDD